jgi:hypothetical protein
VVPTRVIEAGILINPHFNEPLEMPAESTAIER